MPTPSATLYDEPDFSIVLGGPLYQLWRRARLTDDTLHLLHYRISVLALICWLPLLVLCAVEGRLLPGAAALPFLYDMEIHARFLVALPLLVVAELVVHERLAPVVRQFMERQLLPAGAEVQFRAAIASAVRLRNSAWVEIALVALVLVLGNVIFNRLLVQSADTWYATVSPTGQRFSMAGWWYGHVSLPIFQFLACRWYFRLFLWTRFLWQVSRIRLRLLPTHPDGAGGLSFLSSVAVAYVPVATAHGVLLAGWIANQVFYFGAKLPQYVLEIAMTVGFLQLILLGPLVVFAPQLAQLKRVGRREYDALAQRYAREFDAKWLRGGAPADEPLLGSGDIQSLADLGNFLEVVHTMRPMPITKTSAVALALATLAPIAPLLLTMMPLEELIKRLFGVLF